MTTLNPGLNQEQTPNQKVPAAAGTEAIAGAAAPAAPSTDTTPKPATGPSVSADVAKTLSDNSAAIGRLVEEGKIKGGAAIKAGLETGDFSGVSEKQGEFIIKKLSEAPAVRQEAPVPTAAPEVKQEAPAAVPERKELVAPAMAATLAANIENIKSLVAAKAIWNTQGIKAGLETGDFSGVSAKQAESIGKTLASLKNSGVGVDDFIKTLKKETTNRPTTPALPGLERPISGKLQALAANFLNGDLAKGTQARFEKAFGTEALANVKGKIDSGTPLTFGEYTQVRRANAGAQVANWADALQGLVQTKEPIKNPEGQLKKGAYNLAKQLNDAFRGVFLPASSAPSKEEIVAMKEAMKQDPRSNALLLAGSDRNRFIHKAADGKDYDLGVYDEFPSVKLALRNAISVIYGEARAAGTKVTSADILAKLPVVFRENLEKGCVGLFDYTHAATAKARKTEARESPTSTGRTISASAQATVSEALAKNPEMNGWPEAAKELVKRGVPVDQFTYKVYNELKSALGVETKKTERPVISPDQDRTIAEGRNVKTFERLKEIAAGGYMGIPEAIQAKVKAGLGAGSVTMTEGEYNEIRTVLFPPAN